VFTDAASTFTQFESGSTLVPLGDHVMTWESDYLTLASLLEEVEDRFREVHPGKTSFLLDYEYKKMKPGHLVVKQVREVSLPSTTPSLTPFLLNDPRELCTFQGESADVFANHRLKTRMSLATKSAFLTPAVLAGTLFADASVAYAVGGSVKTLTGSPAAWPSATHEYAAEVAKDKWKEGTGPEERTYAISASPVPELLPPSLGPLVGLRDFTMELQADYATPVTSLDWQGNPIMVSTEAVTLGMCPVEGEPAPGAVLVERSMSAPSGAKVKTSFYWPPPPTGITAGYTAPLYKWVETTIEGLTQSPIVLKGFYAQTYRPEHHNFVENFIFEPRLEAGIDPAIVAELEAKGIRMIYIQADSDPTIAPKMWTIDPMGAFHPLN
jgi:hypothetical protein